MADEVIGQKGLQWSGVARVPASLKEETGSGFVLLFSHRPLISAPRLGRRGPAKRSLVPRVTAAQDRGRSAVAPRAGRPREDHEGSHIAACRAFSGSHNWLAG